MTALGKRTTKIREGIDREKLYPLAEAVKMVKERAKAKFDETIEVAMNLGIDPRHADLVARVVAPEGGGEVAGVEDEERLLGRQLGDRDVQQLPVAEGAFSGDVGIGPHTISVTQEGYERYDKKVTLVDKQTLAETVTLERPKATSTGPAEIERSFDG